MKNSRLSKALAVAVIILFLGLAVQPSVAVQPDSEEREDDCNLCPKKVSKPHLERLTTLLDRLDKYDNQLSEQSKLYPELEEKYQDLSNRFTTLTLLNEILKLNSNWFLGWGVICFFLFVATGILMLIQDILYHFIEIFPALNELYEDIYNLNDELLYLFFGFYQCISWPPWENGI
jgi:hypothetical protein